MALFASSKAELWRWQRSIVDFLAGLRLVMHARQVQTMPVSAGFPWLGFVLYPTHKRVKARKVVQARRRLRDRCDAWRAGRISFGAFDASVQGLDQPRPLRRQLGVERASASWLQVELIAI